MFCSRFSTWSRSRDKIELESSGLAADDAAEKEHPEYSRELEALCEELQTTLDGLVRGRPHPRGRVCTNARRRPTLPFARILSVPPPPPLWSLALPAPQTLFPRCCPDLPSGRRVAGAPGSPQEAD